jgi:hypothetical protein
MVDVLPSFLKFSAVQMDFTDVEKTDAENPSIMTGECLPFEIKENPQGAMAV